VNIYYKKKNTICGKIAKYDIGGNACCNTHKKILFKKKYLKTIVLKKKDMLSIATCMYSKLDKIKEIFNVDKAIIENQPTFKNPIMKTISVLLYAYYVQNMTKLNKSFKGVYFVSPGNKAKLWKDKLKNIKKSKRYSFTKKISIEYCNKLINKKWQKYLSKFSKKDDLCDAYLQGYTYFIVN